MGVPAPVDRRAFSTYCQGIARVLTNEVRICQACDPASFSAGTVALVPFTAVWDTGATGTVITAKVAAACGLQPTGVQLVHHVQGSDYVDAYHINMLLPSDVMMPGIRATEGKLNGFDVLVGMDVISQGDFAVSNCGGQTVFTFQTPAGQRIDFVSEINRNNARIMGRTGRNELCPCGSRRKYKHCHGKRS